MIPQYPTNLQPLADLLTAKGVEFVMHEHPIYKMEGTSYKKALKLFPLTANIIGQHQIIIDRKYSVVRGGVFFGYYEMMDIVSKRADPKRFSTPEELLATLYPNKSNQS